MSTYTSEPGNRLGGRYRLEDRIAAGAGWTAWKAIDETLARAVTVFTFTPGFPRISEVVTAARAASRLTDPRLAQVFDVEDDQDRAYIVMEWAAGETLADLLSHGPLDPGRAAQFVAEAATALSSAHAAGIAHLCLSPGSIRWSPTGEVKVVGLGMDAALSGITADDPVLADTQGLGRLLYAALTGYWPGPESETLPAAPLAAGLPRSPRQVVAGVPTGLSDVASRALRLGTREATPTIDTPDELAQALRQAMPAPPAPPDPRPESWRDGFRPGFQDREEPGWPDRPGRRHAWASDANRTSGGQRDNYGWDDHRDGHGHRPSERADDRYWNGPDSASSPVPGPHGYELNDMRRSVSGWRGRPTRSRAKTWAVIAGAAAFMLAAVMVAMWLRSAGPQPRAGGPAARSTQQASKVTVLQPTGASGFDPLTSAQSDKNNERSGLAHFAIDNSLKTAWVSQWYKSATFGGLKAGVGLLIDMGKSVRFTQVTVTFGAEPGTDVQLLVGNSNERSKSNLESMTTVASASNATGATVFRIKSQVAGRYLVIWFTRLPVRQGSGGSWYMAQVFNVTVNGTT